MYVVGGALPAVRRRPQRGLLGRGQPRDAGVRRRGVRGSGQRLGAGHGEERGPRSAPGAFVPAPTQWLARGAPAPLDLRPFLGLLAPSFISWGCGSPRRARPGSQLDSPASALAAPAEEMAGAALGLGWPRGALTPRSCSRVGWAGLPGRRRCLSLERGRGSRRRVCCCGGPRVEVPAAAPPAGVPAARVNPRSLRRGWFAVALCSSPVERSLQGCCAGFGEAQCGRVTT